VQLRTTAVETHVMKMLASVIEDQVRVTMICGAMLRVHTTYPLFGWVRSGASKYSTKPIRGSGIDAGGGGADLTSPEMQGRLHSPGATSCGKMRQDPRKPDGTEATSFCFSRPVSCCPVGSSPAGFDLSGSRCTTLAG
jgi:hypothetical protein